MEKRLTRCSQEGEKKPKNGQKVVLARSAIFRERNEVYLGIPDYLGIQPASQQITL